MAVTITLTDEIETELQNKAEAQKRSVEDLALEILGTALEAEAAFPLLEEVVAKIKASPPNPGSIRPPPWFTGRGAAQGLTRLGL